MTLWHLILFIWEIIHVQQSYTGPVHKFINHLQDILICSLYVVSFFLRAIFIKLLIGQLSGIFTRDKCIDRFKSWNVIFEILYEDFHLDTHDGRIIKVKKIIIWIEHEKSFKMNVCKIFFLIYCLENSFEIW